MAINITCEYHSQGSKMLDQGSKKIDQGSKR